MTSQENDCSLKSRKFAADYLDVSTASLDRLVRGGKLKSIRFGGNVKFRVQDLAEFAERHATEAA